MADNITLVVDSILNEFGADVLLNGDRFCAILDDMTPKLDAERKIFRNMQRLGVLQKVHRILQENTSATQSGKLDMLLQDEGFIPEWRRIVLEAFSCPVPDGLTYQGSFGAQYKQVDTYYNRGINFVRKIVFACDAGMGSSAMGATMLRNKLKDAGITDIEINHSHVSKIPSDCQIVITHHELAHRVAAINPNARVIPIRNFMGAPEYAALVDELVAARSGKAASTVASSTYPTAPGTILLEKKNIVLNCWSVTPEEAIRTCGKLMVYSGYVTEGYIQGMLERNAGFPVAIGSHVAIPHGTNESRKYIQRTGLVVMTCPDGIVWGEDKELVRLVIGIASRGEEHLDILNRIVELCETEEDTDALVDNATVEELYKKFNGLS